MRKIMIVAALLAALMLAEAHAAVYPSMGRVIDVNRWDDTVTVEDPSGNLWEWYGAEDWEYGDLVALLMDDEGTEIIWDDTILETIYMGGSW